jgi:hypothetical protein
MDKDKKAKLMDQIMDALGILFDLVEPDPEPVRVPRPIPPSPGGPVGPWDKKIKVSGWTTLSAMMAGMDMKGIVRDAIDRAIKKENERHKEKAINRVTRPWVYKGKRIIAITANINPGGRIGINLGFDDGHYIRLTPGQETQIIDGDGIRIKVKVES